MSYLFTSESVSEGHPDKVADQIADTVLDHFLAYDSEAKVACEVLVTSGQVILAGEVKSKIYLDIPEITRKVIADIGYTKPEYHFDSKASGIISLIHEQSSDIRQGVERKNPDNQGAGDQGIIFGYATNETYSYLPLSLDLSHRLMKELAYIRKNEPYLMPYLCPDAKSQVTVRYSSHRELEGIDTIVVSTQHDEFDTDEKMRKKIFQDIKNILIPRVIKKLPQSIQALFIDDEKRNKIKCFVNPTGRFVTGGPHGDTGLTGRKIIVDTYGGKGSHGGGALSGKDPSKVDRSAAYAARHIAKNLVAAGVADEILIQIAYAIGVAEPISLSVNTYDTGLWFMKDNEIAKMVTEMFDMRPKAIEERLNLRNPIYRETAAYGHMGRYPEMVKKSFDDKKIEVELFPWEKLDYVKKIKTIIQ